MQTATFYYEFIRSAEGGAQLSSDHSRLLTTALHEATEKYLKRIQPLWEKAQLPNRMLQDLSHQRQIKAARRFESRIAHIEECLAASLWLELNKAADPGNKAVLENYINAVIAQKKEAVKILKERVNNLSEFQSWLADTERLTGNNFSQEPLLSPSRLDRVEIKAKAWCRRVSVLPVHQEPSYNTLYQLFKHKSYRGAAFTSQKPVAFFKGINTECVNTKFFPLTAQMEKMVYDVALKLNLSSYFAETKLTVVQTLSGSYSGSLQRRIRGVQLAQLFDLGIEREIPLKTLIKGFYISYLFGTTDGRLPNLFFDKSKKRLIHFDNSRSLPNSNGYIRKWGRVYLSFRCHLLQLIHALEEIPQKFKAQTLASIAEIEPLLGEVEAMIRERAEEESWPVEWVDPPKIMKAMLARVANLKDYLPQAETLWDFMLTAEPEWAFISALRLLISLHTVDTHHVKAFLGDREPLLIDAKHLASSACCGEESVYDIFVQAVECNIDPERVRALCQENRQLLPWIKSLCKYYDESLDEVGGTSSTPLGERYAALYRELEKKAEIDDKDVKSVPKAQLSLLSSTSLSS